MAERLAALTREEYKKLKEADAEHADKSAQSRATPIWLRLIVFVILMFVFATAGALVGYSGMGHGKVSDVLTGSAFSHIYDLVEKK